MTDPEQLPLDGRSRRDSAPATPVASRTTALPLAGRDRTVWRLAALALILSKCRARTASLEQLHVLMWSLRDLRNAEVFRSTWHSGDVSSRILRAFDSLLDDTLMVARATGIVSQNTNGKQVLTEVGSRFVRKIQTEGLLEAETRLLSDLGSINESGMWARLGKPPNKGGVR